MERDNNQNPQKQNDQRQNRPAIKVCAVDDDASQKVISQNGKEYSKAELYEGIIRNIEYSCMVESAYDTAFQHAVESGFGWLRVYTDYSTKDSFVQDILIKAIRDNAKSKLICVGDDWQSIYRFTGSDIDIFVNFSDYFGYTETCMIQKTYRNSQQLIDIAAKFILRNNKQIKKRIKLF